MQTMATASLTERDPCGLRAGLASKPGHVQVLGTWEADNRSSHGGGKA